MVKIIDTTINFKDCFGIEEEKAPAYPFQQNIQINDAGHIIDLNYSQDLWKYMMQYIFPGVFQNDFDIEKQKASPALTIYENLFIQICEDFYHSFIEGRDDTIKTNINIPITNWNNLSDINKRACFLSYLNSRQTTTQNISSDLPLVQNLSLRKANVRIWLAYMLIMLLEKIQDHTVNVGRATTRYSQTAQAISIEMASNKYNYLPLNGPSDFFNAHKNETNAKELEDMKTYRITMQKEVDKESTNLIKANSDAEVFTAFINKIIETDLNALRTIFI